VQAKSHQTNLKPSGLRPELKPKENPTAEMGVLDNRCLECPASELVLHFSPVYSAHGASWHQPVHLSLMMLNHGTGEEFMKNSRGR
jgi:hypothetical protein